MESESDRREGWTILVGMTYLLHMFLGGLLLVVLGLGWLQDMGIVGHGKAQGLGMMVVLGIGLPALFLVPVAVVLSAVGGWGMRDARLLSLGALLCVTAALAWFTNEKASDPFLIAYAFGSEILGILWVVNRFRRRKSRELA